MAGDRRRGRWTAVAVGVAVLAPTSGAAQEPSLFLVNDSTTVESVDFEIQGELPWREARLRNAVAIHGPSRGDRIRRALDWLPLVSSPLPVLFDPVSLQMDVARLRSFLSESGYPGPAVDYRVRFDTQANAVHVTMTVDPGPPRILEDVQLSVTDDPDASILDPDDLEGVLVEGWIGERVGDLELQQLQERAVAWARARGFAFALAEARLVEGSDPLRVGAEVELRTGPVATVGGFRLENQARLDSTTIMRHLLIRPGDTIRWRRLDESAKQLEELSLVNAAVVQVMPDQLPNPTPRIRVLVLEGKARAVSGRAGYSDDRGLLSEVRLENRDFLGGGRTLRASIQAETGIWSFEEFPNELYGATLSLTQPRVGSPRLDLIPSLSWAYENGAREEARQISSDLTLVLRRGPNRFISLTGRLYQRDIVQVRGLDVGSDSLLDSGEVIETLLGSSFRTALTLAASWGTRDDLANPNRGWVVNGSLGVTGLDPWSDVQYVRGDLSAAWLHETSPGGVRILARGRVGRLFPFGRSREGADSPLSAWLRLGTATFTAGGVETVRGYGTGLVGPKVPEFFFDLEPDTTIVPGDHWIPVGGIARWAASAEVQLPYGRGGHYGMLFVDGARVHTPDTFFQSDPLIPAEVSDGAFYTLGAGLGFRTPVGGLRLMVGYKLNPGPFDLRNARAVLEELLTEDGDLFSVPENPWRRFRLHLALGQPF